MNRTYSNRFAIFLFTMPALLLFALLVLIPIVYTGYYSMLDWNLGAEKIFVGLENYRNLFTDEVFVQALLHSLAMAALMVFIQLPLALLLALILGQGIKLEAFYRTIYFIPVVISSVVIGILWRMIYNPDVGLLNSLLRALGLDALTQAWLANLDIVLWAVSAPIIWQFIGYHMLIMYAAVKSIPEDIIDAARIDGAGPIGTALRIKIPLMKPILKVNVTFAIIGALKIFDMVYIMTRGGPLNASEVPATLMVSTIFLRQNYGTGSAMAMIIVLECLLFTLIIYRLFKTNDLKY